MRLLRSSEAFQLSNVICLDSSGEVDVFSGCESSKAEEFGKASDGLEGIVGSLPCSQLIFMIIHWIFVRRQGEMMNSSRSG